MNSTTQQLEESTWENKLYNEIVDHVFQDSQLDENVIGNHQTFNNFEKFNSRSQSRRLSPEPSPLFSSMSSQQDLFGESSLIGQQLYLNSPLESPQTSFIESPQTTCISLTSGNNSPKYYAGLNHYGGISIGVKHDILLDPQAVSEFNFNVNNQFNESMDEQQQQQQASRYSTPSSFYSIKHESRSIFNRASSSSTPLNENAPNQFANYEPANNLSGSTSPPCLAYNDQLKTSMQLLRHEQDISSSKKDVQRLGYDYYQQPNINLIGPASSSFGTVYPAKNTHVQESDALIHDFLTKCSINSNKNNFKNYFSGTSQENSLSTELFPSQQRNLNENMLNSTVSTEQNPPLPNGTFVWRNKDQMLCRNIQEQVSTNPNYLEDNIEAISQAAPEMLCDQFGNYAFQFLFKTATVQQRRQILNVVAPQLTFASQDAKGSRCIQVIIEYTPREDTESLAKIWNSIKNDAEKLCTHPHGNHIIQKCLDCMPISLVSDLVTLILANIGSMCVARFGCYVVQRCFDLCCRESPSLRIAMVRLLVTEIHRLFTNNFGNYAVQYIFEHCPTSDMDFTVNAMMGKSVGLATNKYGSNVIDTLISRLDCPRLIKVIMAELCAKENLLAVIRDRYGNHVILRAVETLGDSVEGRKLAVSVWKHVKLMKGIPREQRIVEAIIKIFPIGTLSQ